MNARELLRDSRQLFWLLHVGGWVLWGAVLKYAYTAYLGKDAVAPGYALYVTVITLIAILLSLPLRYLFRFTWDRPLWLRAVAFFGASFAAAWLWFSARSFIYSRWFEEAKEMKDWLEALGPKAAEMLEKFYFHESIASAWLVMAVWATLYHAIKYSRVFQEVRESALKAAAMAHEAQLKMLRYQLNPHFLFNTLNAISTLILERDTQAANRMVTKLSSFLRYSLDNDPMQRITLRQEIEALKLYLDIEKVRFEDRLQIDLDIERGAETALIPSLLLQPLVENAIKHGIAQVENHGRLRIAARVFAGELLLELADNGPGAELVDGEIPNARGVGLRNSRERLRELYGTAHSFRLSKVLPHGLGINIRIPCEREHEPLPTSVFPASGSTKRHEHA